MLRSVTRRAVLSRVSPAVSGVFRRTNVSARSEMLDNSLIEELKHLPTGPASLSTNKDGVPQDLSNNWSTGYDRVFRQTHSKEVMRLWSLLDVCLDSEQFDRGEAILYALHPLSANDNFSFIDDFNKFLAAFAKTVPKKQIETFVATWKSAYNLKTNIKTDAILISTFMDKNYDFNQYVQPYLTGKRDLKALLGNVDIFGIQGLRIFVEKFNIDPMLVPEDYRELITQESEPKKEKVQESYFMSESSELPPTLHKPNAKELKSVDTFGMKVIRHTLLSLQPHLNSKLYDNLDSVLENRFEFFTKENTDSSNFFNVYKQLTPEQQKVFESALDEFNIERQSQLESRSFEAAQERWKHDFEEARERGDMSMNKDLNAKLWTWYEKMMPLVEEEIERCKKVDQVKTSTLSKVARAQHSERVKYAPYLKLLDAKKVTVITILEILKNNSTGGVHEGMRTARAVISVAKALEMEFRSEQLLNKEKGLLRNFDKPSSSNVLRKYARVLNNFKTDLITDMKVVWPQEIKVKLGSVLVSTLMHVAKVEVKGIDPTTKTTVKGSAPAFYHSYQYHNGVKLGVLKVHKQLGALLSGDKLIGAVQPQMLPMLVKPRPWTNWNNGGYYYSQNLVIRSRDAPEQLAYLKASTDKLGEVYEGLNVLGDTAWTVNERVFKVMTGVWNTGDAFLDIPKAQEELELPVAPPRNSDPSVINEWRNKVRNLQNDFANNRSTRCDANYKLEIARAYLGEKFYFPHNLDFRGRAYPFSPHFNHMGNDLSRGLLIFWHGKELGETGLRWLKIHLSNLFGFDKAPLQERVEFAEKNMEEIMKTAEDPEAYKDFWMKAEKPWQALATILDLADAMKLPDPTKHISHQPVHQDGTCNGLQHYAALGGDIEGATQVNLAPADRPQDVYTHVAKLVRAKLEDAAEKGDPNAIKLKDHIKRKVVKQTVMTNVYGVTYVGATQQIHKQLQNVFDETESYKLSTYLTKHVFACMRELFEGAHLIQDWLAVCAKIISRSIRMDIDSSEILQNSKKPSFMASVIWTTPLNLPIVQPYRAVVKKQVSTNLQTVFISDPFELHQVDSRKQMAAFPPNFIHSLDASHMLLSAVACHEKGLEFAAVHDSYWTHAADVETMSASLREAFIKLHEVDLVERLKQEFDERYQGFLQLVEIPSKSDVGKKIVAQRKEWSRQLGRPVTLSDEVYMERQRQARLKSNDPKEFAEGSRMVTTVSLIEKEDISKLVNIKVSGGDEVLPTESEDGKKNFKIKVFAPINLPPIPPKGEFDVQDLRKSQYFFS